MEGGGSCVIVGCYDGSRYINCSKLLNCSILKFYRIGQAYMVQ